MEPFDIDERDALGLWGEKYFVASVANCAGVLDFRRGVVGVSGFSRESGNATVATFGRAVGQHESGSKWMNFFVSREGRLVSCSVASRHSSRSVFPQCKALAKLAYSPELDPENVPRTSDARGRIPWLGAEVQKAGKETIREKGAAPFLKADEDETPLVVEVVPGSPADRLGVKPGDILLTARHPGSKKEKSLTVEEDRQLSIDWEAAFNDPEFAEIAGTGLLTPWPNAEGGVNGALAQFGVGSEVVFAWVSGGVRKEGTVKLDLAPPHFRNAPRSRSKALGMTVCDMTHEVRRYFKFGEDAPGVVVSKVKSGGVANVAGIRALELVIAVDGAGVKSAKDFTSRIKGLKEFSLTVQRLDKTRLVPVKLDASNEDGEIK